MGDGEEFVISFWMKYDAQFDWGTTSGFKHFIIESNSGSSDRMYLVIYNDQLAVLFQGTSQGYFYCNQPGRYTPPLGEWVKYDWYVKVSPEGTNQGVIRAWANNQLIMEHTGIATIGSGAYTHIWFDNTFNEEIQGPNQNRYWDNIRIGPGTMVPSCQVLIPNKDYPYKDGSGRTKYFRGDVFIIRDDDDGTPSPPFGASESLPDYVRLRVTGVTKSQLDAWTANWNKTLNYTIVNQNASGWRVRMTVDPTLVSVSGDNQELRAGVKDAIQHQYGFSIVSFTTTEVVFDIPKGPSDTIVTPLGTFDTLADLKADWNDKWEEIHQPRRWYFPTAVMNTIEAAITGGADYYETTKAEAQGYVRDRVDG